MLSEIAITPQTFDISDYDEPARARAVLLMLKKVLMEDVMVRDLRAGRWYRAACSCCGGTEPAVKSILKSLRSGNRLRSFPQSHKGSRPESDLQWFDEAAASHEREELRCILATPPTAAARGENSLVAIDRKSTRLNSSHYS